MKHKADRNKEIVRRASEGEPYADMAEEYGVTVQRISRIARDAGVPARTGGSPPGEEHPNWSGGRTVDRDGYVYLTVGPNHQVREHRLVAEMHLGRPLKADEHVHHKNGNRSDNRWGNLEVLSASDRASMHSRQRGYRPDEYRRRHVEALRSLVDELGRAPAQRELLEALDIQSISQLCRPWQREGDSRPYADATKRLYEAAGVEKRPRGGAGHIVDSGAPEG